MYRGGKPPFVLLPTGTKAFLGSLSLMRRALAVTGLPGGRSFADGRDKPAELAK
jgi:hypothetical protein